MRPWRGVWGGMFGLQPNGSKVFGLFCGISFKKTGDRKSKYRRKSGVFFPTSLLIAVEKAALHKPLGQAFGVRSRGRINNVGRVSGMATSAWLLGTKLTEKQRLLSYTLSLSVSLFPS